jgi:hypothetical protein
MARGTVVGEPVVSQANSKAYADNYERMFGKDHKPERGRWSFGRADPSAKAIHASIVSGRWHEGQKAPDGTDIGTPAKRRAWMKATGTADYDDYRGVRARKAAELEARHRGELKPDKSLRDLIGRELYKQKVIL